MQYLSIFRKPSIWSYTLNFFCKLNTTLNNPNLVKWLWSFWNGCEVLKWLWSSTISHIENVLSGVPQGSVLGPLLFLLCINNLPSNVNTKIHLYADNCVIYHVFQSPANNDMLNNCFENFCNWCRKRQMNINFSKTVYMSFLRHECPFSFSYSFNCSPLQKVLEYKYLWNLFSHDMSWPRHIDLTCNNRT